LLHLIGFHELFNVFLELGIEKYLLSGIFLEVATEFTLPSGEFSLIA